MKLPKEPDNYDWRKWRLFIAEEHEACQADGIIIPGNHPNAMNGKYPNCSFVYLWNNTIQIKFPWGDGCRVYEIDLCRSDELDWLKHLSHKTWATVDMIFGLASACRRIGRLKGIKSNSYYECWSFARAYEAACHIETRIDGETCVDAGEWLEPKDDDEN